MFVDKKTGQIEFFDPPKEEEGKNTRLWRDFMSFHLRNPHIYESLKNRIFKAIEEGREVYAIQVVAEEDRWDKRFRISNSHCAYYARLFIEDFPEYKSFFRLRPIKQE